MEKLYSLTDKQFVLIEPILQEERDVRGRKPKISDRHARQGALYILREGCRCPARSLRPLDDGFYALQAMD